MAESQIHLTPGARPAVSNENVYYLCKEIFGLELSSVHQLDGYDDKNFHVKAKASTNPWIPKVWPHGYVLKVLNKLESQNIGCVEAQNEIMLHLDKQGVNVPIPVKNLKGEFYYRLIAGDNNAAGQEALHIVRLLVFKPGKVLKSASPSNQLYNNIGQFLADLHQSMNSFSHPSFKSRESVWMLHSWKYLYEFLVVIKDDGKLEMIKSVLEEFNQKVHCRLDSFNKGLIHGDINEHNLLVNEEGTKITGIIDFGDVHYSNTILEIAIALCYLLLLTPEIKLGQHFLEGYLTKRTLPREELSVLKVCICTRLCQSLVLGLYTHSLNPENSYLLSSQDRGWSLLQQLYEMDNDELLTLWNI